MNFKIKKNILLENLNYVSKALSNRNIIPVLNGIKFELNKKGLYLTATDNEITIKTFIDKKDIIDIKEEGTLIIFGRYILDIIRKLPVEEIEISELDGNKAIISSNNSKYNLNCFKIEDFPKIEIKTLDNPIKLSIKVFKDIINETAFAASNQESRPVLTGINFKIQGNYLECIATDSYRLARKNIILDNLIEENVNIILPSKSILDFTKSLEESDEIIELHVFENKILFKYKNILFQSSLLNGTYPNTDNFIPNDFDIEVEINLEELFSVIDRASLITQSKDKNIIGLELENNKIIITSSSQEIGKVEEIMFGNKIKGNNIKISFSSKYMMEAIKTFKGEKIILCLNGEIKPIILKSKEQIDLIQLILPIKTY